MKTKLNFKEKMAQLQLEGKESFKELALLPKKNKARYTQLLQQKEKASMGIKYIEKNMKRRDHVFAFADSYRSVTAKECQNFYKKNPKEFKRMKIQGLIGGSLGLVSGCFLARLCFMEYMSESENIQRAFTFGGLGVFQAFLTCLSVWFLVDWARMSWKGPKSLKAKPNDFLMIFESDKNLKDVWLRKNGDNRGMYLTTYQGKEKDLKRINAYHETKNWLQQWSGGNPDRLCKVEWRTLCGIAKKYGKHLTPVDWGQECADSSV